jgi:hypothetical protein
MAALAAKGEVGIAPLPVVAHFERPGLFRPLGDFCIACLQTLENLFHKALIRKSSWVRD